MDTGIYQPKLDLIEFETITDSVEPAERAREEYGQKKCGTGINYLDKALGGGIGTSDILLITAPSGVGKSELALAIASHNVANGKRVHLLALESDRYENTQRLLYRELARLYFSESRIRVDMQGKQLNYSDWLDGKFSKALYDLEREATNILKEKYKNLKVFYRTKEFGVEELTQKILAAKDETDMFILDHLHYVDLDPNTNENVAMMTLVKTIRDIALLCGKPMVVVCHVRKNNTFQKQLLPDLSSIHGSSAISKICTHAVALAPCFEPTGAAGKFYTYVGVLKNRRDGSKTRYVGKCIYNSFANEYMGMFKLGRLVKNDSEWKELEENETPYWAKPTKEKL